MLGPRSSCTLSAACLPRVARSIPREIRCKSDAFILQKVGAHPRRTRSSPPRRGCSPACLVLSRPSSRAFMPCVSHATHRTATLLDVFCIAPGTGRTLDVYSRHAFRTSLTRDELLCSSSADRAQIYLVPMSSRAMRRHLLPPARTHQACLPPSRQLLPLRLLFDALPLRPCRRVLHDVSCSDSFQSVSQVSGTGAPRSKFSSTARRT